MCVGLEMHLAYADEVLYKEISIMDASKTTCYKFEIELDEPKLVAFVMPKIHAKVVAS